MKYYQLSFTLDKSVRGKFEMPHTISIESPNFLKYISEKSKNFNCSSLTGVDIPNSVTNIYNCVFSGCSGLTSITIPSSVTSLRDYCFYNCIGLTSITIPSSVTSLGEECFKMCI